MKTKLPLSLLVRLALCAAIAIAAWLGADGLEIAARTENSASAPTEVAMATLARVPVAAPWLLQLSALLRGR